MRMSHDPSSPEIKSVLSMAKITSKALAFEHSVAEYSNIWTARENAA